MQILFFKFYTSVGFDFYRTYRTYRIELNEVYSFATLLRKGELLTSNMIAGS